MMNYNFTDVEKYLRDGGKPEDMMNAFADLMNKSLAIIRREDKLRKANTNLVKAWNEYMAEYFTTHNLPNGYTLEDWEMNENEMDAVMKRLIEILPVLAQYTGMLKTASKKIEKSMNNSRDVISDFFDKFDI